MNLDERGLDERGLDEYQERAATTAIYPQAGDRTLVAVNYVLVALGGEVGEALNHYKKLLRDGENGQMAKVDEEVGDMLWYIARYASERGVSLSFIAERNLEKLAGRAERGEISDVR